MEHDYELFRMRYEQIEKDFLELTDFIEIQKDFNSPCYKFGSSKLMDFSLKVCSEIETLFKIILKDDTFNSIPNIEEIRNNQNINGYRETIGKKLHLYESKLFVKSIKISIKPFENFDESNPEWFRTYSKYKHDKTVLIKKWNMKYALLSLGALITLVALYPKKEYSAFKDIKTEVFTLSRSNVERLYDYYFAGKPLETF